MTAALLYVTPLLVLLAALLTGRYPGEALIGRAIARRRPALRAPRETGRRFLLRTAAPRGGALVAHALAGRAPPPTASARAARA